MKLGPEYGDVMERGDERIIPALAACCQKGSVMELCGSEAVGEPAVGTLCRLGSVTVC